MGWRERIGSKSENINVISYPQKEQKEQKGYFKQPFATIAAFAPKNSSPEPENLGPAYDRLWIEAWALADWIDDNKSGIPVETRRAKLPELNRMRSELSQLEGWGFYK